jgi:hypothetical protein
MNFRHLLEQHGLVAGIPPATQAVDATHWQLKQEERDNAPGESVAYGSADRLDGNARIGGAEPA